MKSLNILIIVLTMLWARPILSAETPVEKSVAVPERRLAEGVTTPELIRYAYTHNPSLQEAREAWTATVEKFRLVTSYPDAELMVTYFPDPIETRLGPQDWNASLGLKIPFPGKLTKAGEAVKAEARIAHLKLDLAVRNMIADIREALAELHYIHRAREVARQNLELVEHLRKVAETAHGDDRANLMDVVKAQSQLGQLRYDLLLLNDLAETETTRINGLLNRDPGAPLKPIFQSAPTALIGNVEEIYQWAETHQEEIQIKAALIEKAEADIGVAKRENGPDFKVGLFYAGIGDPDVNTPPPDAGRDALGVQFGVSIPLWFGKNEGRVNRAEALKRKAQAGKAKQINDTHSGIRALYFRLQNVQRLITLYRDDLLPQAAQSFELAETWFRDGDASFADFVEAQAVFYNFQLTLARAHADYEKYLVRLERLVGRSLTDYGQFPEQS